MEREKLIMEYKDIDIFLDGVKLNKEQKDILTEYNVRRKKIIKKILSKGYIFQLGLGFFRNVLKLKQSRKFTRLTTESLQEIFREMKIDFFMLKLLDRKRGIVLEIPNEDTKDVWLILMMLGLYEETVLHNQYNISPEKIKDKIVIDAGSNIGEFAIYCAKLGAKKVYAFEPVTETFKLLKKQIEINNLKGKVIPINMALGDKNEIVRIVFGGAWDTSAKINADLKDRDSEQVEVVKLDNFIKKEKIGFIKMDVEGYEENALRGASRIIKRDKPILSFSAYHKPTDKQTLPKIVKELRKDYKIRLLKIVEEDFYCE